MAEPFTHDPEVQEFIDKLVGQDKQAAIREDRCVLCGKPATHFSDEVSRREFSISGLCQGCQDLAFTEDEDAEGDD